jgi:hypothetical protein
MFHICLGFAKVFPSLDERVRHVLLKYDVCEDSLSIIINQDPQCNATPQHKGQPGAFSSCLCRVRPLSTPQQKPVQMLQTKL